MYGVKNVTYSIYKIVAHVTGGKATSQMLAKGLQIAPSGHVCMIGATFLFSLKNCETFKPYKFRLRIELIVQPSAVNTYCEYALVICGKLYINAIYTVYKSWKVRPKKNL